MSQASGTIPVIADFSVRPNLAGLAEVEAQVQQAAQRMATMGVTIPNRGEDFTQIERF